MHQLIATPLFHKVSDNESQDGIPPGQKTPTETSSETENTIIPGTGNLLSQSLQEQLLERFDSQQEEINR